jgi:hypothetical protein
MSKEAQIKILEKKIKQLEKVISTQRKLIEVLKTLPGNRDVKLKQKGDPKKNGLRKRTQGTSGSVVGTRSKARKPESSGPGAESNSQDTSVMEKASVTKE